MRQRSAILHIGVLGTGSAARIAAAAPALAQAGIAAPLGTAEALAALAQAHARRPDRSDLDDRLAACCDALAALPEGARGVMLSSERFAALSEPGIAWLKRQFDALFHDCRVIACLDRHDRCALRQHAALLREGHAVADPFALRLPDHARLLDRWSAAFGADALTPCLAEDLAAACGLSALPPAPAPPALSAAAEALIARVLAAMAESGPARRAAVADRLATLLAGGSAPSLPPRAAAIAYCARYRAGDERVRARWFADGPALFDADFSAYPEAAPPPPNAQATLDAAMRALGALVDSAP